MNFYEKFVLPRLINLAMQNTVTTAERARFAPLASGTVLEVGAGSGLNIPFYAREVRQLYALDPSLELWRLALKRVARASFPVEFIQSSAESIPFDDETIDTVVTTWTLCTIPDPLKALTEMKRVLKPPGRLLFIEHGRSPDSRVVAWQDRLTPLWRRIAGGCHLNRRIDELILTAGFGIDLLETGYTQGPKPLVYLYRGLARRPE